MAVLYLENAPGSRVFHCRGELDATSNPESFIRKIAGSRLRAIVTNGKELAVEPGTQLHVGPVTLEVLPPANGVAHRLQIVEG